MTIETLKSPTPRNRNGISVIKSKFLSVSSMNSLFATDTTDFLGETSPTRWLVNFMPVAHVVLTLNLEFMSTMCLHEYRCILFLQLLFQFVASVLRL